MEYPQKIRISSDFVFVKAFFVIIIIYLLADSIL